MTTLPAIFSESEALRILNLPASRRQWLREQVASTSVGGGLVYAAEAIERLREKLEKVNRVASSEFQPVALHRR